VVAEVFTPETRPSWVVAPGQCREYRAAATNHEATLFIALIKK
jgi:hypothetical protein